MSREVLPETTRSRCVLRAQFFKSFVSLLQSPNYVTRRQSLKVHPRLSALRRGTLSSGMLNIPWVMLQAGGCL